MAKFKALTLNTSESMNLDLQLDDFVPKDDPSRIIEGLVMDLDTSAIESTYSDIGQKGYHPKMLLSVIFYGYTQGLRSGRKLSKACQTDIRYIYLSKGYRPSKTTLNDFRKDHYRAFEDLFIQVVQKCIALELVDLADPVFGDGSKIRANASSKRSKSQKSYEKWLGHLQADIAELEAQEVAAAEQDSGAEQAKQDKENKALARKRTLARKIKDRLDGFKQADPPKKLNLTDPDAHFMRGKKGYKDTYYNPQIVVSVHQFILHNHISTSSSDRQQLEPCLEGFKGSTGQYPALSVWDCAYSSFANEQWLGQHRLEAYIPDQDFGKSFEDQPFHRHHFQYDPQKDEYVCPQGQPLVFKRRKKDKDYELRIYQGTQCEKCAYKDQCTTAAARTIQREKRQPLRDQMYHRLLTTKGRQLSAMRKHRVEPVFGHLKHNLGYRQFLLRSLEKVQAEFHIMCIAYNLMKIAKFWLQKAALYCFHRSRKLHRTLLDRLNLIVNELLASFTRCFIYKLFYNASG